MLKNRKLLTDEQLREDIELEFMFMHGTFAYYRAHPEQMTHEFIKKSIDEQINLLMPVIKRHIKRRLRDATGDIRNE